MSQDDLQGLIEIMHEMRALLDEWQSLEMPSLTENKKLAGVWIKTSDVLARAEAI